MKLKRLIDAQRVVRLGLTRVETRYPDNGRPKTVFVPGHDGHSYSVILRYGEHGAISGECHIAGHMGKCPAARYGNMCWHVPMAIETAFREAGFALRWFDNPRSCHASRVRGGVSEHMVVPERGKPGQEKFVVSRKMKRGGKR